MERGDEITTRDEANYDLRTDRSLGQIVWPGLNNSICINGGEFDLECGGADGDSSPKGSGSKLDELRRKNWVSLVSRWCTTA